jgi:hypothetical protein
MVKERAATILQDSRQLRYVGLYRRRIYQRQSVEAEYKIDGFVVDHIEGRAIIAMQ